MEKKRISLVFCVSPKESEGLLCKGVILPEKDLEDAIDRVVTFIRDAIYEDIEEATVTVRIFKKRKEE